MWSRLLALALLVLPAPALAGVKEKVAALAPSAVVLVVDAAGKELVAQNADEPFVPASVAKIVTAWLAMEVLGADYRFETRFYLDDKRVLYVRGGGDPFLISEELAPLATDLVAKIGKAPITGIVVDGSYYPSNLRIPGIEDDVIAYDALNSALAVNFNTVYAVRSGAKVRSAEAQTPITPLAIARLPRQGAGRRRPHQSRPGPRGRPPIRRRADRAPSSSEPAAACMAKSRSEPCPKDWSRSMFTGSRARSRKSSPSCFSNSNNFTANQIFLEIGGRRLGGPVSLEKSLKVANEMFAAHGLADAFHLEEGSGISRDDRFTARGLAKVLELFAPHADLLHGHDGGLNKTGTMDGVRTLAGYADTSGHGRVHFVISLAGDDSEMRYRVLGAIKSEL